VARTVIVGCAILRSDGAGFDGSGYVVVEDGMIAGLGHGEPPSKQVGEDRYDLPGCFLIPGLIDSHFHLISRSAEDADDNVVSMGMVEGVVTAERCLRAGVTAVRDCGCRHRGIHTLRRAIDRGLVPGPRCYLAGRNPTGSTAPAHWRNVVVDGEEELRAAIRTQIDDGADWVKLILAHAADPADWSAVEMFLTETDVRAGVEEAHRLGVKIGCHCEGWEAAALAVRAGMDSLDHAPLVSAEVAAEMAQRGTFYIPTVWAFTRDAGLDLSHLSQSQRDSLSRWQDEHRTSVERAYAAGVPIAAGSDAEAVLPDRDVLLRELRTLAECGLSSVDLLRAATSVGAALMDRSDLGRIEVGVAADLVVLDSSPLENLDTLADPRLVIARGQVVVDRLVPGVRSAVAPGAGGELASVTSRWAVS
jgi:imidazolonepropionase-like amidohydrolase